MKPKNFFHKIASFLGMQDIDFEENEDFSRRYLLKGEDEELIRYMMDDQVLRFFTVQKDWSLEGVGYFLIIYKKHKLLNPQSVKHFYNTGLRIYNMLKA